jgi:hypothetical protein
MAASFWRFNAMNLEKTSPGLIPPHGGYDGQATSP